mmetsp:Transcript_2738/g.5604  ORF Transcript_2738/g.5604 Transcript_2738/m.5604 type:complete len:256 (+) Transcript_2738:285-1052(+)
MLFNPLVSKKCKYRSCKNIDSWLAGWLADLPLNARTHREDKDPKAGSVRLALFWFGSVCCCLFCFNQQSALLFPTSRICRSRHRRSKWIFLRPRLLSHRRCDWFLLAVVVVVVVVVPRCLRCSNRWGAPWHAWRLQQGRRKQPHQHRRCHFRCRYRNWWYRCSLTRFLVVPFRSGMPTWSRRTSNDCCPCCCCCWCYWSVRSLSIRSPRSLLPKSFRGGCCRRQQRERRRIFLPRPETWDSEPLCEHEHECHHLW